MCLVSGKERVAGAAAQGDGRVQEAGASLQGVEGLGGLHLLPAFTSHTCCLASHLTPTPGTLGLPSHLKSAAFPPAARPRTPRFTLAACAPTSHLLPHLPPPPTAAPRCCRGLSQRRRRRRWRAQPSLHSRGRAFGAEGTHCNRGPGLGEGGGACPGHAPGTRCQAVQVGVGGGELGAGMRVGLGWVGLGRGERSLLLV